MNNQLPASVVSIVIPDLLLALADGKLKKCWRFEAELARQLLFFDNRHGRGHKPLEHHGRRNFTLGW